MRTVDKKKYQALELEFDNVRRLRQYIPETIISLLSITKLAQGTMDLIVEFSRIKSMMELCGEDYSEMNIPTRDLDVMSVEEIVKYKDELLGACLMMEGVFSSYTAEASVPKHIVEFIKRNNPHMIYVGYNLPDAVGIVKELREMFPKTNIDLGSLRNFMYVATNKDVKGVMVIYDSFNIMYNA